MLKYKLTDENAQTHGNTQWGENVTHTAIGKGKRLCSEDVIHFYDDPLLAVLMNPIHADFQSPLLWECRVAKRDIVASDGLKGGCKKLTTIKQIPLPKITIEQRVRFAILCALKVYTAEPKVYTAEPFVTWASGWLIGKNRTARAAARAAAGAAEAAARAAAGAATEAAGTATGAGNHQNIDFVSLAHEAMEERGK